MYSIHTCIHMRTTNSPFIQRLHACLFVLLLPYLFVSSFSLFIYIRDSCAQRTNEREQRVRLTLCDINCGPTACVSSINVYTVRCTVLSKCSFRFVSCVLRSHNQQCGQYTQSVKQTKRTSLPLSLCFICIF